MKFKVRCTSCGKTTTSLLNYKCPRCGKPLDIELNLPFEAKRIRKRDYSFWRYAHFFPYAKKTEIITLGEGWTPLVKFSNNLYFKLENLNPTGSFKDRGSTTLISTLHRQIKNKRGLITEDSSGNAGASIAAYAARTKLKAEIYVPENVTGPKFNQIQFYGANVTRVSGTRSQVAEKAQAPEPRKFYLGHILHPLFRDGIRSLAYEIAEQLEWHIPESVYLPVSAGTLLLGVLQGFKHMVDSGVIDEMPKITACQTRQVSPLYHSIKKLHYKPPQRIDSIADALVSTNPPLLELMIKQLQMAKGDAVIVEETEILNAFKELAEKGFFVEPSSAVAYAAYKKQTLKGKAPKTSSTAIILSGSGLKSSMSA